MNSNNLVAFNTFCVLAAITSLLIFAGSCERERALNSLHERHETCRTAIASNDATSIALVCD